MAARLDWMKKGIVTNAKPDASEMTGTMRQPQPGSREPLWTSRPCRPHRARTTARGTCPSALIATPPGICVAINHGGVAQQTMKRAVNFCHGQHLRAPEGVAQVVDVHGQIHVDAPVTWEQHGSRGEEGVQVEREAYDVQRRPPRLVAAQVEGDQGEQTAQQERGRGQAFAE